MCLLLNVKQAIFQKFGKIAPPISHNMNVNCMGVFIDLVDDSIRRDLYFLKDSQQGQTFLHLVIGPDVHNHGFGFAILGNDYGIAGFIHGFDHLLGVILKPRNRPDG